MDNKCGLHGEGVRILPSGTLHQGLTWGMNSTKLLEMAQQRLCFLRVLRKKYNFVQSLLVSFYHSSTQSVLIHCYLLLVW